MSYEKEEQARLMRQQSKQAIALAMEGRWRKLWKRIKLSLGTSLMMWTPTIVWAGLIWSWGNMHSLKMLTPMQNNWTRTTTLPKKIYAASTT